MSSQAFKTHLLSASTALALFGLQLSAYPQANTPPVGVILHTLTTGTTTPIGVPLLAEAAYSGAVSAVTSSTLTTTGVTWTAGEFSQPGTPYFVLMLSGGQTGRTLRVTANTSASVTLEVGNTSLLGDAATPAFAVAAGDRFELFPGETLASLFGDGTVDNPVQLQKGTSALNADTVQLFNGTKWVSYFFHSTNNFWMSSSGVGGNQNSLVLPPDTGMLIGRRGATMTLAIAGRAPTSNLLTRIAGGTTSSVPVRFPTDTTLGALNFSNPGTWVVSDDPLTADRINLFNGVKWVAYWKSVTGSIWRQVGGDGSDQGGKVIPAGSSILVQKQGTATDSKSFFTQSVPYTP